MSNFPRITEIPTGDVAWACSASADRYDNCTLGELIELYELSAGDIVYVGERRHPDVADYLPDAGVIVEQIAENAYEEAGEIAESYPEVSDEGRAELDALLRAWAGKHCAVTFWLIDHPREYVITQADIDGSRS